MSSPTTPCWFLHEPLPRVPGTVPAARDGRGSPESVPFSHLCYHTATINRHCAANKHTEENDDSNKIFVGTQCTVRQKLVNSRIGWRFETFSINILNINSIEHRDTALAGEKVSTGRHLYYQTTETVDLEELRLPQEP